MTITLTQICQAIETTLSPAVTYTQTASEMKDGMADQPTLQVYPQSGTSSPPQNTDRSSFQANVRQQEIIVYADLYATPRSEIGEDFALLLPLIDAMIDEIEKQDTKPYFGLIGIKAFRWDWLRATFQYNDLTQQYAGARFTFYLRVF